MNLLGSQLSFDTASLASRQSSQLVITKTNFAAFFTDRIYEICNDVHPLLAIEYEAVKLIQSLLEAIIAELLEYKPLTVVEVDRIAKKLFPEALSGLLKDGWDCANRSKNQKAPRNISENQMKLTAIIREALGVKDRKDERRDKKEIEKIANYLYYTCESLIEDILRHTGKFVKNLRNDDAKITHQNLDVALSADRALQELRNRLKNVTEAESPSAVPFSEFNDYLSEQTESVSKPKQTYEAVAKEMLREERKFIRELNRINIFRRRIETFDVDKKYGQMLFANLTDIYELALKVERTLEDAIELSDTPCIGMGMWDLAEACEFNAYSTFLIRTDDSENMFARDVINMAIDTILKHEKFAELFSTEDRCFNSSLDGQSFRLAVQYVLPELLLVPMTHFYQFVEYIRKLKMLTSSEDDGQDLHNCISSLNNVRQVIECLEKNTTVFMEPYSTNENIYNVQKLHEIQSTIESFTGSPIGKTCADMMKEGELSIVRPILALSPDVTKNKKWKTERYVYLFDQLLLMCKKHKNTVKFKDRMPVHMIDVSDIPDNEIPGIFNAFQLLSRDKSHVPSTYVCMCKSSEEKKAWMAVLVLVTTKSILDRILDTYEKEETKRIPLIIPSPDQYRFAEPDSEENISFEDYTSSSGIPVIKNGTVLKLVERLTYHSYTDSKYQQTFLISYRSFCTPNELLYLLLERFNIPTPHRLQHNHDKRGGPLAGRYDTVQSHGLSASPSYSPLHEQSFQRFRKEYERPVQLRVLSVINQWAKFHWYDFECDPALLESLEQFLQKICDPREKYTKQHKKYCKTILTTLEKRKNALEHESSEKYDEQEGHVNGAFVYGEEGTSLPPAYTNNTLTPTSFGPKRPEPLWHAVQKGDVDAYDLLTLHPLEIGRQLTLLHFDLYRAIKPIELVEAAWTKHDKYRKSPQLLKLTDHSTLLTYWVSKSIVETESLEERCAMFCRALEVMSVFEELHNFTGLVAFLSALRSSCVHRLTWCWERLDNEKLKCFDRFVTLCEPRWIEMQKRLQNINPPCIPFFGHYLTNIYFFEAGNSTFVNSPTPRSKEAQRTESAVDKKILVSFLKCRRISDLIREIQMYQNEPYPLQLEPSIRQFFESINPKSEFKNNDALETYLYEKSLEIQPKDTERPANEVKPKHPAFALRSPGIKPPKTVNHYTPSHQGPSSTPTASTLTSPMTQRLNSQNSSDDQNTVPRSGMSDSIKARRSQNHKIPPPLYPRNHHRTPTNGVNALPPTQTAPMPPTSATSSRTSPAFSSTSNSPLVQAPELPPKRSNTNSISPLTKSPLTPSSKTKNFQSHFQFPSVPENHAMNSSPPMLPPRPSTSGSDSSPNQKENSEQLRVSYASSESSSPSVVLSVPLPPALPPPRGSRAVRTPPPRPPKSRALMSSSNEGTSSGLGCYDGPASLAADPISPSTFVNLPYDPSTPPPLPPKTRRMRRPE